MADNYSTAHAVHLAKHAHHFREKHEKLLSKVKGIGERFLGTVEVGGGALLGGIIDGRSAGRTFMHVPLSLWAGAFFIGLGHTSYAGEGNAAHLNNLGNGFVANYLSSVGHAFGDRWRMGGIKAALHGGGVVPSALGAGAGAVGMPDPATMANMQAAVQAAAAAAR